MELKNMEIDGGNQCFKWKYMEASIGAIIGVLENAKHNYIRA